MTNMKERGEKRTNIKGLHLVEQNTGKRGLPKWPLTMIMMWSLMSPGYNHTGWLGVKHQVTYGPQVLGWHIRDKTNNVFFWDVNEHIHGSSL